MNLLENQKINNGINLVIGLGGIILAILGTYLTINANKKYDGAYAIEIGAYHSSLNATIIKILLNGPSGGLPEFKSWTYHKQKPVLEQTLGDMRSQLNNITLIEKSECKATWNEFIDYLMLVTSFEDQNESFIPSEYYRRIGLIRQNCI